MSTAVVRISEDSRKRLRELASREGATMQQVLDRALEIYRRQRFLDRVNNAYRALRKDVATWAEVEREREDWDATLLDGLPADERWTDDGRVTSGRRASRTSTTKAKRATAP